ncbi:IMPACT family protein [Radicibacter daui]|uniref:IMPACT family protein n=1 Tax=Radicibacter daui TaxID=3064829 RepID=UPI004046930F
MFILPQTARFEQIVKKSRFLAIAIPVENEDEAKRRIAAHSTADANHNCWAWRLGQAYRFSDDGEPGGTAGKPILAAIEGQQVDKVAVVVTRWFGGVLLGTGGLVRAYGGTAAACLRAAELVPFTPTVLATAELGFSDLALVKARLAAIPDVRLVSEDFTATGASLTLQVPEAELEALSRLVSDLTSGRTMVKAAG